MNGGEGGPKPAHAMAPTATDDLTRHGALDAADTAPWWNRSAWEQAIERAIAEGRLWSTDDLQARDELPSIGNALGGSILRLHREGKIRRVGYRPSNKPSRAGGAIAVWGPPTGDRQ